MPSIQITAFGGIAPELHTKLSGKTTAQVAHNCLLWDGRLRPMPQFVQYAAVAGSIASIGNNANGDIVVDAQLQQLIVNEHAPATIGRVGLYFFNVRTLSFKLDSDGVVRNLSMEAPVTTGPTVMNATRMYRSDCPKRITYAITGVRENMDETAPLVIGTLEYPNFYEGDAVYIQVPIDVGWESAHKIIGINLYRTVSGLETGEQINNPLDTGWHLVNDVQPIVSGVFEYGDDGLSYRYGMDALPSKEFYVELDPYTKYVTQLDGGWLAAAGENSVQVSERYLWHAFPVKNYMTIPASVEGMVAKGDVLYVGTQSHPYSIRVDAGESSFLNLGVNRYPEQHPCVEGTLVSTSSGAMYCSEDGIISLEPTGMTVMTKELFNPGDVLYYDCAQEFQLTTVSPNRAVWWKGTYFAYNYQYALGFMYDPGDTINGAHPLQQLVTLTVPSTANRVGVDARAGICVSQPDGVYHLPLPGTAGTTSYENAPKQTYRWKSKKFVTPQVTAFGAVKVVHQCNGPLCLTLWADCKKVFTTTVDNCRPFRLPSSAVGTEWEIELEGTATVHEVHVATSIRDLSENG